MLELLPQLLQAADRYRHLSDAVLVAVTRRGDLHLRLAGAAGLPALGAEHRELPVIPGNMAADRQPTAQASTNGRARTRDFGGVRTRRIRVPEC